VVMRGVMVRSLLRAFCWFICMVDRTKYADIESYVADVVEIQVPRDVGKVSSSPCSDQRCVVWPLRRCSGSAASFSEHLVLQSMSRCAPRSYHLINDVAFACFFLR
jgi:hypothetical protein